MKIKSRIEAGGQGCFIIDVCLKRPNSSGFSLNAIKVKPFKKVFVEGKINNYEELVTIKTNLLQNRQ